MLVHCAGGPANGALLEVDPCTWYRAFEIHVHAVFHLARAAVPCMAERGGGAILLISSAAGSRGCAGAIAYGWRRVRYRSSRGRWRASWPI